MELQNKVKVDYLKLLPDGSQINITETSNIVVTNIVLKPNLKPKQPLYFPRDLERQFFNYTPPNNVPQEYFVLLWLLRWLK